MRSEARVRPAACSGALSCVAVALFALFATLALSPRAQGQILDLDSAAPPQPGEGKALMTLAESLEREVRRLQRDLQRAAEDDERERTGIAFRLAVRRLTIALARHAETIGEPASPHAVAALQVYSSLDLLDKRARDVREDTDEARELENALARFTEAVPEQITLPSDASALDEFLRDRFAIIVQLEAERNDRLSWSKHPERCGWLEGALPADRPETPDLRALIERLEAHDGVGSATTDALTDFADLLETADGWWIHHENARCLRLTLAAGAAVLDELPEWAPESVRAKLIDRFSAAARDFTEKERRAGAREALHELARLVAVLQASERLRPPRSHAEPMRDALLGLAEAVQSREPGAAGRLRSAETVVAILAERRAFGDGRSLARELRPGWRVLSDDAESTEKALYGALSRLVSSPQAMMDPALAGAVAAHRRALDDLHALQTISQWLGAWLDQLVIPTAPGEPRLPGEAAARRLAAMRVLDLCQDLSRERRKADALAELRDFAADLRDLAQLPGEPELRTQRGGVWNGLAGGRAAELALRIDNLRDRWLSAWATEGSGRDTGEDPLRLAAELRTLAGLSGALEAGVALTELKGAAVGDASFRLAREPGLLSHAGFFLSDRTIVRLHADVADALPALTARALDGGASAAVQRYTDDHALHALIAALHRGCVARKGIPPPRFALAALPMPASARIWLHDYRQDLASISRYTQEYAFAAAEGESRFAEKVLTHLNIRAGDVLAELAAEEPAAR